MMHALWSVRRICLVSASVLLLTGVVGCGPDEPEFDAQGVFEAEEVLVSAEATGRLPDFDVSLGDELGVNQVVGHVDSTQLVLQRNTLRAQIRAVLSQKPDAAKQIATLSEQIAAAQREVRRVKPLVEVGGLPSKTLDDAQTQVDVLQKQLAATQSSLDVTTRGLQAQTEPLTAQIAQIDDQIARCTIVNPVDGTVLAVYAEEGEMAAPGRALYKIAGLSTLKLRAYIDGTQLPELRLGDSAAVFVDDGQGGYRSVSGTVTWIAEKAEFTPKTIRTKDERANLVYAILITVPNDGRLNIGMYGEVRF